MEDKTSQPVVVTISLNTLIRALLLLLGVYAVYFFRDLVVIILTAVVVASAMEPATLALVRIRIPRIIAVIAIYALMATAATAIMYTVVPSLIDETYKLEQTYQVSKLAPEVFGGVEEVETVVVPDETLSSVAPIGFLDNLKWKLANEPGEAFRLISTIFGGVLSLVLITVISFYLAVQERGIEEFLRTIIPIRNREYIVDLWRRSQVKIGRWMQGQLILVLIIGIIVYLSLSILGMPYALSLAILAGFAELIPIFGPILAAIPAMAIAMTNGITLADPGAGAVTAIALLYLLIQQFENNLIYPWVVRKVVGVPPLVVIIALVMGGTLVGFLGMILAVPVAAALMEFTNDLQKERKEDTLKEKNDDHEKNSE